MHVSSYSSCPRRGLPIKVYYKHSLTSLVPFVVSNLTTFQQNSATKARRHKDTIFHNKNLFIL
jgi:hypothetical protein